MTDDLFDLSGLAASLAATLADVLAELPAVELALAARPEHGDLTTNAALVSAKMAGMAPRDLATVLGERWLAVSAYGDLIPPATPVVVTEVTGTTLTVRAEETWELS